MNIKNVLNGVKGFVKKNSTPIITTLVVSGFVGTVLTAIKDTPKAEKILNEKTEEKGEDLTKVETVKCYAKAYWRTIALGSATIILLVSSQIFKDKQYASLATAYTIAEKKILDYKDSVIDVVGEKKAEEIRERFVDKSMEENPINQTTIINTEKGKTLFYDTWSGRYFHSDMESVRKAINNINKKMLDEEYVSLDEFYFEIGLPECNMGSYLGWNHWMSKNVDVQWGSKITEGDVPCITMTFTEDPFFDFEYYSK